MLVSTIIFWLITLLLMVLNRQACNRSKGIAYGFKQLLTSLPAIALAMALAGFLEILIPEEYIKLWMSTEAGFKGIIIGVLGGSVLAFGPYAAFPLIATIYSAGAGLGTVIAMVVGWTLLGLHRVPYEVGFIGLKFSLLRMGISIPFCLMDGLIAYYIEIIFF